MITFTNQCSDTATKTIMEVADDATMSDLLEEFVRFAYVSGYQMDSIENAIRDYADDSSISAEYFEEYRETPEKSPKVVDVTNRFAISLEETNHNDF